MFNPFSFIPQFAKKWTDGTRFDLLKTIGALMIWLPSIFLLKVWNEVDTWNDVITINAYRAEFPDSTETIKADLIQINHPYMAFSNLYENKLIFVYRIYTSTSNKHGFFNDYRLSNAKESQVADFVNSYGLSNIEQDSITAIYEIGASIYISNNDKKLNYIKKGDSLPSNDYIKSTACLNNGKTTLNYKRIKIVKNVKSEYNTPDFLWNKSDITISTPKPYKIVFKSKDVSQCYYNLHFESNTDFKLDTLRIGFSGAVRFSGINPVPDIYSYNGIEYTDANKIDMIKRNGITTYCQFLEAAGIQSIRIYLLSTIATLFFGIFVKLILEIIWRHFKCHINRK